MHLTPLNLQIFRLFSVEKKTKSKQQYEDEGAALEKVISDKECCAEVQFDV
jgi:hypothetical protein